MYDKSKVLGVKEQKAILFEECGANYYAYHILKKMKKPIPELSSTKIYSQLIEKYGDKVHKVFFGSASDEEKYEIIDSLQNPNQNLSETYQTRQITDDEISAVAQRTSGAAFLGSNIVVKNTLKRKPHGIFQRAVSMFSRKPASSHSLVLSELELNTLCHETAHLLQDPNLDDFMRPHDQET